jgi:hypothetical protein
LKIETISLPYPVPYTAQVTSPELSRAIFDEGMDAALDPRWKESGASSAEEYAYWSSRACGAACVKMCVEALGGEKKTLMEWVQAGMAVNGYLVEKDESGRVLERGWVHQALAQMIREAGYYALATPAAVTEFPSLLKGGHMLIASVSSEIGGEKPITRRGGHLVVVRGAVLAGNRTRIEEGRIKAILVNNPSGRPAVLRENASIPYARFSRAYSGRVIAAGANPIKTT